MSVCHVVHGAAVFFLFFFAFASVEFNLCQILEPETTAQRCQCSSGPGRTVGDFWSVPEGIIVITSCHDWIVKFSADESRDVHSSVCSGR